MTEFLANGIPPYSLTTFPSLAPYLAPDLDLSGKLEPHKRAVNMNSPLLALPLGITQTK